MPREKAKTQEELDAEDESDSSDGGSSTSSEVILRNIDVELAAKYAIANMEDGEDGDGETSTISGTPRKMNRRWAASDEGAGRAWRTYLKPRDVTPVMPKLIQPLTSEFLGTFILVFVCVSFACSQQKSADGGPFTTGLTVALVIMTLGPISGAHINPAVSLAFLLVGELRFLMFILYCLAQGLGATAASFVVRALVPSARYESSSGGVVLIPSSTETIEAIAAEVVVTGILVFVILHTGADQKNCLLAPIAIGLTVVVNIYSMGEISGCCMNPARSIGATVIASYLPSFDDNKLVEKSWMDNLWYCIGDFVGATLAAFIFRFITAANPKYSMYAKIIGKSQTTPEKMVTANGVDDVADLC